MPVLKQETKEIELPSYKGSKVEISTTVTWKDVADLTTTTDPEITAENGVKLVARIIKKWNFTDEDGNTLPINEDNVGLLAINDLNIVVQESGLKKGA